MTVTRRLRRYLMQELSVTEISPESIISKLDQAFLEAQPDDWILALYTFLNGQPALRRRLDGVPLIRLEDGIQVPPRVDGQPQAFLPGAIATAFPTVRASVCATEPAREFLRLLGLTEPDPVDDVVRNILPKYRDEVLVSDAEYEDDIRRILTAFGTDSKAQREKLLTALRDSAFIMAVDAGDGTTGTRRPDEVYLATERLKELFAGVRGVLIVDDTHACLRGEAVALLEACGASRCLQPTLAEGRLSREERREIRRNVGLERATSEHPIEDKSLRGLESVLLLLPQLEHEARRGRAALLWEALADVENRRGSKAFEGHYTWSYAYETKTAPFDAAFVRQLNETAWVPDRDATLQRPDFVLFDSLGWKANPFLLSKIRFKPPIIEMLAMEAGIEPGVLDMLKKHGVTSVAELAARLGLSETPIPDGGAPASATEAAAAGLEGDAPVTAPDAHDASASMAEGSVVPRGELSKPGGVRAGKSSSESTSERAVGSDEHVKSDNICASKEGKRTADGNLATFVSYIGVHSEDEDRDPDGLDRQARMALEAKAISFIRSREPGWQPTPPNNPGFDLFMVDEHNQQECWCEVKAMTGSLDNRSVCLSGTQFDCAREHGENTGFMWWNTLVLTMPMSCESRTRQVGPDTSPLIVDGGVQRLRMPALPLDLKHFESHAQNPHNAQNASLKIAEHNTMAPGATTPTRTRFPRII